MADIFISYSRKDSAQAIDLADRLRSDGQSVWIDQYGIVGAERWATEIVEGIRACSTFIVLLSQNSIESENVLRELSLASEKRKRVLPVELEPTVLPSSFEYPLAGLQRVAFTDFEAILHAHRHGVVRVAKKDERKSLMILPFEDLSPTGDNGWFADGVVSELITAFSNVKSLRLSDNQTTKEFKRYQGQLTTYAHEMQIRYFVQGDVRKFGDNIKVAARLLDIETGDYLWQESLKGTMENIFDFQEEVAHKVLEGLNVQLSLEEKRKLSERGTENADAYELNLKGSEYFTRQTKEGFQLAAQLWSEAIKLDPRFAEVYAGRANALAMLYRGYDRDPKLLEEGLTLIREARRLKPEFGFAKYVLSAILILQGKLEEAERVAQEYVQSAPEDPRSHFALGFFYQETGQAAKAIAPFEEVVRLKPDLLSALWNLVISCNSAKDERRQVYWADIAIPRMEKHKKLFPEDENNLVHHAVSLHLAGRDEEAKSAARKLERLRDGLSLYNAACLLSSLNDFPSALSMFQKAMEAGFRNIRLLKSFLENKEDGIYSLKGTSEYETVRELVEKLQSEADGQKKINAIA